MNRSRPSLLIALAAVAQVALMLATWPLWMTETEFPRVPVALFEGVPMVIDQISSVLLMVACAAIAWQQIRSQPSLITVMVAVVLAIVLALLDQHRLQPWHWLTILLFSTWLLVGGENFPGVARVTIGTIYIFAALSRFGPDVHSQMSGQVLTQLLNVVGLNNLRPDSDTFFWLAVAMNSVELAIGVGLLIRRTRRLAVVAAVLLHLCLIVSLSPWGLNHHSGVLLWNAFLLTAVWIAFRSPTVFRSPNVARTRKATAVSGLIVLFPLSGLFGIADNWLSWQVYSPRPEVVQLRVAENRIDTLPDSLQPFVQPPQPLDVWCSVRFDRWSLEDKRVPVYPEDRFQLAVVRSVILAAQFQGATTEDFEVTLERPNTFPWWERTEETVDIESLVGESR